MATIELYARRINLMSDNFNSMKSSINDFKNASESIRNHSFMIDTGICNIDSIQHKIQTTIDTQQGELDSMDILISQTDEFFDLVVSTDESVAEIINNNKNDFYEQYSYLKLESDWEKFWNGCKDGIKKVGEWCREHWKFIATVIIVIVAVALLVSGVGTGLGAAILAGACSGAILGAGVGGIAGGIKSIKQGEGFFKGFENGAFNGAVGGAIGGAITGGIGFTLGPALTMTSSILRGAGIGSLSSGISNMCVTTIDYLAAHRTLNGSLNNILVSGLSGAISGGIIGGFMGGLQFKIIDSLKAYSGDTYKNINSSLRKLTNFDKGNSSKVRAIHLKLSHSGLPQDMTLYRGTSTEALGVFKNLPPNQLVGKVITEDAFMSTSTASSVANKTFNGNMQLIINAPKGANALDISNISHYSNEAEVLFDYGTQMIIDDAKMIGNVLNLNVTIQ